MRASIVIPNWNGLSVLRPCLAAIAENTGLDGYEVIVLDNGSDEPGIAEAVRPYPRVRLLREHENHGFARGNNIAARAAAGDFLVFLNNDTLPQPGWLSSLIEMHQATPGAGIVGARLLDQQGATLHTGYYFDASIGAYVGAGRGYPAGARGLENSRECEVYAGCGLLIRRTLFDSIGGFDESYFQGYEDWDLCLKVRALGFKILYCPGSRIVHLENVSMRKLSRKVKRQTKERNRARFEARWKRRLFEFRVERPPGELDDFGYFDLPRDRLFAFLPGDLGRVLELGCGAGALGARLKNTGKARYVCGVELHAEAAGVAATRLDEVVSADIETLEVRTLGRFDTIIAADVLEHLRDPWGLVFRLRTSLEPGGVLVASIPNVANYKILKKLIRHAWRYEPGGILDRTHLRFFSRASVEELFENAGFAIERIERDGNEHWWSRWFGWLDPRIKDFTAVQYYVLCRKVEVGRR